MCVRVGGCVRACMCRFVRVRGACAVRVRCGCGAGTAQGGAERGAIARAGRNTGTCWHATAAARQNAQVDTSDPAKGMPKRAWGGCGRTRTSAGAARTAVGPAARSSGASAPRWRARRQRQMRYHHGRPWGRREPPEGREACSSATRRMPVSRPVERPTTFEVIEAEGGAATAGKHAAVMHMGWRTVERPVRLHAPS